MSSALESNSNNFLHAAVSSGMLFNPDLNYAYPKPPEELLDESPSTGSKMKQLPAINLSNMSEPEKQCVIALKEGKQLLKTNTRSASVR